MATSAPFHVAIIGAGLSGLTLSLALEQQGISSTIYESRPALSQSSTSSTTSGSHPEPLTIGGAVTLSPNALRVLDAVGVWHKARPKGYSFDVLHFRDVSSGDKLVETYEFGGVEKYGYPGFRIYRHKLITTLLDEIETKSPNIKVQFGSKFAHVVEEGSDGVTFALADGTTQTARLLIGADGIHSRVRRHLYPDLALSFVGIAAVTAPVPTSALGLPPGEAYHLPATLVSPAHGALVLAPQVPDGSEVVFGKQRRVSPDLVRDRAAWRSFTSDKAEARRLLAAGNEAFGEVAARATAHVLAAPQDKVDIWPFFAVPRLERWTSAARGVIIVGDAAHAIAPPAGQGINQAFEDVYMLALLLKGASSREEVGARGGDGGGGDGGGGDEDLMQEALAFWQAYRQERVDRVLELNRQIDLRRMPKDDADFGEASGVAREPFDLEWLYKPDFKGVVDEWFAKR